MVAHFQIWTRSAENGEFLAELGQDRIDRRENGAAVAGNHQHLREVRHDAGGGLGPDLSQGNGEGRHERAVDHLGRLHSLTRCNV